MCGNVTSSNDRHDAARTSNGNGEPGNGLMLVGIGASAGGIEALKVFFEKMPDESGLAFVVILHLSEEHDSSLSAVLQSHTRMPIRQVTEEVKVEPNHVYVIPPHHNLAVSDGHICLQERADGTAKQVPVDLFFRTLASSYKERAIAVVLSGAGTDGSIGVKLLKEAGGVSFAQDPNEAEHSGMPRSAIDTGAVDFVLPVAQMPQKLVALKQNAERIQLPAQEASEETEHETALREVLTLLRARTRHDFTNYKRATLLRRLERRLQVTQCANIPEYLGHVRETPAELHALLRDLLISVTNFFRDPDAFHALARDVVPRLFAHKGTGDQVRVWATACATGEEAYTLAILLCEHAARLDRPPAIQIFATDINEEAIATARTGTFPETIAADVSPERLKRFFTKEGQFYRISREVREMVLFAPHNILRDPPFSKIDLITCRNLLIYLNRQMQDRVLEIFHFALRPDGYLLLGSAESADNLPTLFSAVDKKQRIYLRRASASPHILPPALPVAGKWEPRVHPVVPSPPGGEDRPFSLGELHYSALEAYAPPSVLVNSEHEVVHLSEKASRYVRFVAGEPSRDLLKLVHPDLRLDLRALLVSAPQSPGETRSRNVHVNLENGPRLVHLRVSAVTSRRTPAGYCLVIFDDSPEPSLPAAPPANTLEQREMQTVVQQFEEDLQRSHDQLRSTIEEAETSTEELKASNEELQAVNEELRSASEELETGKEELQSVNEELVTVNNELKEKVEELSRSNSDLQNLISSTQIGTLFLDRHLRIQRYTPAVLALFNLIPADLGRPLAHLTHKLHYEEMIKDAESVLETLQTIEREVSSADGRWFIARQLPYRTLDDKISGVIVTFVDITSRKKGEAALAESLRKLEEQSRVFNAMLAGIADSAYLFNRDGRFAYANRALTELLGMKPEDFVGRNFHELPYPPELAEKLEGQIRHVFDTGETVLDVTTFTAPSGREGVYEYILRPVLSSDRGSVEFVAGSTRDMTERERAAASLRASDEKLRLIVENARDYVIFSTDLERRVTSWNLGAERILGYSEAEILGTTADVIFTPEDCADCAAAREAQLALEEGRAPDERWHVRKDGSRFWGSGVMMAMRNDRGEAVGFVKIFRDQTEIREAHKALEQSREELWAALQETERARDEAEAASRTKDQFLAVLSHELRTPLTPVIMISETLLATEVLPPLVREGLESICRNVQLEAHFIDDLLDVTRISRGKFELARQPVSLHEAILGAVEISTPDIQSKQQRLTVELAAELDEVRGDFPRLQQIFWNLLKNASKFTPEGGELRVISRNKPGRIVVEVIDNGCGIDPNALSSIFEAFRQGDDSITRRYGGLGLGLAISKATVDAHGGSVRAFSAGADKGTTLTVELPLIDDSPLTDESP